MSTFKDILGHVHGGTVLDVATGGGGFVTTLKENLASYTEIVGVDTSERAEVAFWERFKTDPTVRFTRMDAARLEFPDASFDTVSICSSLHHLTDPLHTLNEMKRVTRPGGLLIVSEMYRDHQTDTQLTHVLLHDWWGRVDTARGICHNPTYRRDEIVSLLQSLGLADLTLEDLVDLSDDPLAPDTLTEIDGVIDQYIHERIQGLPEEEPLKAQGESLRERARQVGFHGASALIIIGRRP